MIYPFESVAYNTPVGEISMPFSTNYGYHILKVHDKRPARVRSRWLIFLSAHLPK